MFLVTLALITYRPANLMLKHRASTEDVVNSLNTIHSKVLKTNTYYVKRNELVVTDADDIVFDALSGSRFGTIKTKPASLALKKWKKDQSCFERALLRAQMSVIVSQALYISLQVGAFLLILRIYNDIT
jgi:hypothetical protein